MGEAKLVDRYQIYVGLNNKDVLKQLRSTEQFCDIAKLVCRSYAGAYSMNVIQGGYIHENGDFTEENTIVLTLIDVAKEQVDEIAADLCTFFQQESVMVNKDVISTYMVQCPLPDAYTILNRRDPQQPAAETP